MKTVTYNPINNPAIIFNGVKMRGFFKNNYGYGYDYIYGNKDRKDLEKRPTAKYQILLYETLLNSINNM